MDGAVNGFPKVLVTVRVEVVVSNGDTTVVLVV